MWSCDSVVHTSEKGVWPWPQASWSFFFFFFFILISFDMKQINHPAARRLSCMPESACIANIIVLLLWLCNQRSPNRSLHILLLLPRSFLFRWRFFSSHSSVTRASPPPIAWPLSSFSHHSKKKSKARDDVVEPCPWLGPAWGDQTHSCCMNEADPRMSREGCTVRLVEVTSWRSRRHRTATKVLADTYLKPAF